MEVEERTLQTIFWRLLVPTCFFAALFISYFIVQRFMHLDFLSEQGLRDIRIRLLAFGVWTPVVFCMLYGLRGIFYMPEPVLMALAGFLAGPFYGVGLIIIGSLLAASLAYGFVRLLIAVGKKSFLERFCEIRPDKLGRFSERFGFRTILIWRMLPICPFMFLTYSAAFLRFSFWRYLLAMGLGVVIPAILYGGIGSMLSN